jgi:hypothetical protein
MTPTEASVKLVEIIEKHIDSKPTELYLKIMVLMCEYGDSCYLVAKQKYYKDGYGDGHFDGYQEGYGSGCSDSAP